MEGKEELMSSAKTWWFREREEMRVVRRVV